MGKISEIQWTDATWNPWHGCKKVSPGCKFCYMYRDKETRYNQDPKVVVRSTKPTFNKPLKIKGKKKLKHPSCQYQSSMLVLILVSFAVISRILLANLEAMFNISFSSVVSFFEEFSSFGDFFLEQIFQFFWVNFLLKVNLFSL